MNHIIQFFFLFMLLLVASCQGKTERKPSIMSGAFAKSQSAEDDAFDLDNIREGGELIVATISGPNTYYDYRGLKLGLQYALAEDFAETEGLNVRLEIAKDSAELLSMLKDGAVDIIAYPLSRSNSSDAEITSAGYNDKGSWYVKTSASQLAKALDNWYDESVIQRVTEKEKQRLTQSRQVKRKARAVYLSRDRGVISVYDNLFKNASAITGWDWKLIAAQCYQESAFDPNARSYAGAQGLMQLMPATASELGVAPSEVWQPEKNINAAARYIVKLTNTFSDIRDPQERIKFVLASYNGGSFHVRDAMSLAKKYGKNPQRWDDVAPFILGLQKSYYYKDPVVKYGYMIGSETAGYVQSILERWRDYGGKVAVSHAPQLPPDATIATSEDEKAGVKPPMKRKNKFSSGVKVMSPDDPEFNQMGD